MNRKAFISDQSGATAIEYALIAAAIALAIAATIYLLGGDVNGLYEQLNGAFS